jgi:hypothetical protein
MAERVTLTFDGKKVDADRATFVVNTRRTELGMAKNELPFVSANVRINLNDKENAPFDLIQKLFDLSMELDSSKRIKDVKIEFWRDLSQKDPAVSYSFSGWINSFRTSNVDGDSANGGNLNNYIELEMLPDTTKKGFPSITCGN